ncbi:putative general amino acid permease-1 [Coleophoma crateriformis]|uniref:Putative general amino acid permease-1 n=1 Tax=Coleophoma crateriformis TaxID=565419 RepID=A0A3D8T1W4_9HELO|nr:putative general amino acid permease-1 [Coleophoma crateriformis]
MNFSVGANGSFSEKVDLHKRATPVSADHSDIEVVVDSIKNDHTKRKLKPRHIQLIGIAGTIGTALFVNIGRGLLAGGPASLLIAYTLWYDGLLTLSFPPSHSLAGVLLCYASRSELMIAGMSEMATYLPISSPFITFAGRFVDPALSVAAGYNFFIFQASLVPYEITVCNLVLRYWTDAIPIWAVVLVCLVLYALLNFFAVSYYGESEFWLSIGKVILIVGLIVYTFVTMLGGNPEHDRFGFRYWEDPGPFAEFIDTGDTGRFLGFVYCLVQAAFTIAGPEYVSMTAGEAENPRAVLPKAYKSIFYRLTAFFVLGSLAVGINVPYNDAGLIAVYASSRRGAAASPYVRAMTRLRIKVLPDIVNALILTSAFSAGNSTLYCATRSLYGLALEGKAPKIFRRCTKAGVPYMCVLVVFAISMLAFLQVNNSAAVVLNWFVSLVTASQLINFCVITFTYTRFKKACEAQDLSRDSLPYKAPFQPYAAWIAFGCCLFLTLIGGWQVFLKGAWDVPTFLFDYMMVGVFPVLFFGWKFIKGTKWLAPHEVDLTSGVEEIEEYTRNYNPSPSRSNAGKYLDKLFG